jgi:hypothetical protein
MAAAKARRGFSLSSGLPIGKFFSKCNRLCGGGFCVLKRLEATILKANATASIGRVLPGPRLLESFEQLSNSNSFGLRSFQIQESLVVKEEVEEEDSCDEER